MNTDLTRAAGAAELLKREYDLQEDSITVFFTPVKCRIRDVEIPNLRPYLLSGDAIHWYVGADSGTDEPQTQSVAPLSGTKLSMAIMGMIEFTNMPMSVYRDIREYLTILESYQLH